MKITCYKNPNGEPDIIPASKKAQIEALTKLRKNGPLQTHRLASEQKPVNFGLFGGLEFENQTNLFGV